MRKILFALSLVACMSVLAQQDIPLEKAYFKDRKEGFKEARKAFEVGEEYFLEGLEIEKVSKQAHAGKPAFEAALKQFLIAQKFHPGWSKLNYRLGKCYLETTYKIKALDYLIKAEKLDARVDEELMYEMGRAYQLRLEMDKAINHFDRYRTVISTDNYQKKVDKVNKRVAECKYGKKLMQDPVRVFIDNLGTGVNTVYSEYAAVISADNSVMMFTSCRPNSTGYEVGKSVGGYPEDIYQSEKAVDGTWAPARNIGKPANTEEHDATVALSPDGQRMLIYNDDNGDGNLYECLRDGDTWTKPKKLGKGVNTKEHESSASYRSDGKRLYYVSDRSDLSMGGRDIFYTDWDEDKNRWGEPKNVGATINTKYDEEGVFLHPDGKTMYFSSKGHDNIGGYDIFKSEFQGGKWTTPQNIGYPINTAGDDVFFVVDASGRYGYFASVKKGGYGEEDIYRITFLGPEKPLPLAGEDNLLASVAKPVEEKVIEKAVETVSKKITILKGVVTDCETKKPLDAEIELVDVDQNAGLAKFFANKSTGKYLVSLPSGRNYGIAVKKDGYLFHSENFNIPASSAYKEIIKDVCMKKIKVGSAIVLKNIFYDYNKATLRDASKNELSRLIKLMNDNPTIKIELSAHTDSRGSDGYNEKLSQSRAQSCVNYLMEKGISGSRIVPKGYGEQKLIRSDAEIAKLVGEIAKEAAHQENRRTEFKILEK